MSTTGRDPIRAPVPWPLGGDRTCIISSLPLRPSNSTPYRRANTDASFCTLHLKMMPPVRFPVTSLNTESFTICIGELWLTFQLVSMGSQSSIHGKSRRPSLSSHPLTVPSLKVPQAPSPPSLSWRLSPLHHLPYFYSRNLGKLKALPSERGRVPILA